MIRRDHIEDAAIESFFAGNGAGEELALLAAFAQDLRAEGRGPVPTPSAPLAAMLAHGFSTDRAPAPSTAPADRPTTARTSGVAVARFFAGLSAAKVAFGVGIAAASVTAAGAAGALPGPAQDALAAAVEAATPFSFPDSASDRADFGERVSTDATDGGVDGQEVSEEAKENGDAHRAEGGAPEDPGQNGLDRAGETPAAGHVPTSPPGSGKPASAGSADTGSDAASETPAAGRLPDAVPAGPPADAGSQGSTGPTTASSSPAADRLPGSVPAAP
jgi:hypothetical protein